MALKKILTWLLIIILSVFMLDRTASFILDKLYSKTLIGQSGGKINYYLNKSAIPDVVIMGDSRAYYEVNPDSFRCTCFNLAHAGMDDCFQLGLIDLLIQQHKTPKIILLHVEPYFLVYKDSLPFYSQDILTLKYFYGINDTITNLVNHISRFEKWKYALKSYRYNGRIISLIKNYKTTISTPNYATNGFDFVPASKSDSMTTEMSANKQLEGAVYFNRSKTRYLESIIKLAKQNGIRLVFFTSPYFYKLNMDYIKPGRIFLDSIASANKISYLDYSDIKMNKEFQNPSYWTDAEHLNENGAGLFSKIVATDFLKSIQDTLNQ